MKCSQVELVLILLLCACLAWFRQRSDPEFRGGIYPCAPITTPVGVIKGRNWSKMDLPSGVDSTVGKLMSRLQ